MFLMSLLFMLYTTLKTQKLLTDQYLIISISCVKTLQPEKPVASLVDES